MMLNALVRGGYIQRIQVSGIKGDVFWIPGATGGTLTSVGLSMPGEFTVTNSPLTSDGTIAVDKATQSANRVWAGPTSGGAAVPTFRALVSADLPAGIGTVSSVGLTVPSFLSVAGSPVTTSGTLAVTLATQAANLVFAGPTTGAAAAPTFRALVAADMPAGSGSPLTTKGDIYAYSTTNDRFPVAGATNGWVLTVDSTATFGFKWAASSGGGGNTDGLVHRIYGGI
jgi:hypothetical protein